jgi:hypothetical protein
MDKLLIGVVASFLTLCSANAKSFDIETKWHCGETSTIRDDLVKRGEQFIISGAIQNNTSAKFLMSFWVNGKTGNWTVLATFLEKNEITCVVSFGTGFESKPPRLMI